jgi:hypothetical protein
MLSALVMIRFRRLTDFVRNHRWKALCLALCAILAAVFLPDLYLEKWDSLARRQRIHKRVTQLLEQAKQHPDDLTHIRELLKIAQGQYSFGATVATVAIGDAETSAKQILPEIASLLKSPNDFVAREAAIALGKQKQASRAVLEDLESALDRNGDTAVFAAEAVGEIGRAARRSVPVLKSKLGRWKLLDDAITNAIKKIEIDGRNGADAVKP